MNPLTLFVNFVEFMLPFLPHSAMKQALDEVEKRRIDAAIDLAEAAKTAEEKFVGP